MKRILVLLLCFGLCGCAKADDRSTISDLLSYFKKEGLMVGEPTVMLFSTIGANDGCSG